LAKDLSQDVLDRKLSMTHQWQSTEMPSSPEPDRLASLTQKQRDVLDLLVEFKTSKEISRILNISPHTVDQRVEAAKAKLSAASRAELALMYRELLELTGSSDMPSIRRTISERLTYETSQVAEAIDEEQLLSRVGPALAPPNVPEPSKNTVPDNIEDEIRVVPELFDGRWGTIARLATILAFTILICVAFLGGLAIFVQVSHLVGVGGG
jgi:DNA-binding CsgD family transcriptional regulator